MGYVYTSDTYHADDVLRVVPVGGLDSQAVELVHDLRLVVAAHGHEQPGVDMTREGVTRGTRGQCSRAAAAARTTPGTRHG